MLDVCQFFNWSYISLVYSEGTYGENAASQVDHLLRGGIVKYNICLAGQIKLLSGSSTQDIEQLVSSLLLYRQAKVCLLFVSEEHVFSFFDAVQRVNDMNEFTWILADYAPFYLGTPYMRQLNGAFYIDHSANEVPNLLSFIATVRPWRNPDSPWLTELWEKYYGCDMSDLLNSDLLNSTGHECVRGSLDDLTCPSVPRFTSRVYDAVHAFAYALHRLINEN